MNKTKKRILKLGSISLLGIPMAALVSCGGGGTKNPYKNSKTIIVSVDGSQKGMWKEVKKQFEKSEAYKDGFRIKEVEKDAFGTIQAIEAIGYSDENVPDIVYMPQDKLTSLLQQKALRPFKDSEVNSLFETVGATSSEKKAAKKYIDQVFHGKKAAFAFPHNREGLGVATIQDPQTATTYLNQKGIVGAMNEAKLLANLQNLWYGSALFAKPIGTDGEIATDYILYGDGSDWSSGFMLKNKHHSDFKKISDTMSDMWFEPLAKAYKSETKADNDIIGNDWASSNITSGELKNFFQSDEGAVTNMMTGAVQSGKLDYFYTGTWNAQAWAAKGIKTYVNAPLYTHGNAKKTNDLKFQQATGTWSFGINARNNGANKDRLNAIMQVLKDIYSSSAFTNYFLDDSKVPYFDALQKKVETEAGKSNAPKRKDALDLYKSTKFQADLNNKGGSSNPIDVSKTTDSDKIRELARWFSKYNLSYNKLKEWNVSNEWQSKQELANDTYVNPFISDVGDLTYNLTPYDNSTPLFESTLGIVDSTSKLLGYSTRNDLDANSRHFSYKVGVNKLKSGINNLPEFDGMKEDNGSQVHIRKLSKYWTSFNGDDKTETTKFTDKFKVVLDKVDNKTKLDSAISTAKTKFDKVVEEQIIKAKEFITKYSKNSSPTKQVIKESVTNYLNNYWNQTKREALFEFTKSNLLSKIKFSISATAEKKYSDIKEIIEEAAKSLSLSEIFNVLTANGNDRGTFSSQEGRFDRINPQFSTVWTLWNENGFGNKVFLQKAITEAVAAGLKESGAKNKHDVAENKFKEIIEQKLADLFGQKVTQLESANASGHVVIE